jgi:REP element-mobilizing transposase RayT
MTLSERWVITEDDRRQDEFLFGSSTDQTTQTEKKVEQKVGRFEGFVVREDVLLEPVSPNPYDLAYACLLIPRFETHLLKGDLVGRLPAWLQQICVSHAWRLDFAKIRPEYLQWILRVPPSVPPAFIIRAVSKHTSTQIFEDFPRFKRENLSNDFWARNYLVTSGTNPHPRELIDKFIKVTRRAQGL